MTKRICFLVCVLSLLAVSTTAESKLLPGMPAPLDMSDIYSADRPGALNPVVKNFLQRVYVPNTESNTVSVIDPTTYKVIETFQVGRQPQHVSPSYDMTKLWILNDKGNSLTAIDPATGKMGETVPVDDPYNMYYTPDGKYAIVVAEQMMRLMFREPKTMALKNSVWFNCKGIDHMDFSADGTYLVASCEFGDKIIKVDVQSQKQVGALELGPHNGPQDVKISPDGKVLWLSGRYNAEVYAIDTSDGHLIAKIPVGKGPHGLCVYPQPGRYSLGHTGIFR